MFLCYAAVYLLGFSCHVLAHNLDLSPADLAKRDLFHLNARRSFSSCHSNLSKRSVQSAALERRQNFANQHLRKRAASSDDDYGRKNITRISDPFYGHIPTCVLAPESILGPFYLVDEEIRDDIRESQEGVDLLLDIQFFNAATCETLPNVMVDFWQANATGTYGGFEVQNTTGKTWLRGSAQTDHDGVVQMTTIFPGHYVGRAVHIHVMAHLNGTVRIEGNKRVYVGGTAPHVGQFYFPMDDVEKVEATAPYNTNPAKLTRNEDDRFFRETSKAVKGFDGVMTVEMLGKSLSDGLLAYVSVGIDINRKFDLENDFFFNFFNRTNITNATVPNPTNPSAPQQGMASSLSALVHTTVSFGIVCSIIMVFLFN